MGHAYEPMRREIVGLILAFLVIFTLVSLLSYSPDDPSIHHIGSLGRVENFFGLFGAHVAGFFIGLFGVGALWIPVLLLVACLEYFKNPSGRMLARMAGGGILLILATGSLMSFSRESYVIFNHSYSAGGMIGFPIRDGLQHYANWTGGAMILILFLLIGFILATGISLVALCKNGWARLAAGWVRIQAAVAYLKAQRKKKLVVKPVQKTSKIKKSLEPEKKEAETFTIQETLPPRPLRSVLAPKQQVFESMRKDSGFTLPSVEFLKDPETYVDAVDHENLRYMSKLLEQKLEDFGVMGKVVTVLPGPVITRFELEPAPGVKINRVVNLADDLALALRAMSIRIIAPIPGKAVIGIEVPNAKRETVYIKEVIASAAFEKSKSKLTLAMGKDIVGNPVVSNLETMPHLLIAGATGTGKSVSLNTMICSMLYKATPEEVKLIMIDPKRIELSVFDGIPHLITPVVTDMKKATNALFWAVREMERRYRLLSENRVRNIKQYNHKVEKGLAEKAEDESPPEILPYVVIIIDELADLMMVASRDVEVSLTRLAQMARAAGIHLILATQRPSVDILTGVIKANFPTRLSFQVSSKTDSRTIIDANGAEALLGNGDMLFLPPGTAKLERIHGAYISEEEISKITEFLKAQKPPAYDHDILHAPQSQNGDEEEREYDERYDEAVALVTKTGQASISMIQRHLRIGYNRAARIVEMMEEEGVVGPSDGIKPREVLARNYDDMDKT